MGSQQPSLKYEFKIVPEYSDYICAYGEDPVELRHREWLLRCAPMDFSDGGAVEYLLARFNCRFRSERLDESRDLQSSTREPSGPLPLLHVDQDAIIVHDSLNVPGIYFDPDERLDDWMENYGSYTDICFDRATSEVYYGNKKKQEKKTNGIPNHSVVLFRRQTYTPHEDFDGFTSEIGTKYRSNVYVFRPQFLQVRRLVSSEEGPPRKKKGKKKSFSGLDLCVLFQQCVGAPQLPEGPSPIASSQRSNVIGTVNVPDITKIEDNEELQDSKLSDQLEQMEIEHDDAVDENNSEVVDSALTGGDIKQQSEVQELHSVDSDPAHNRGPQHIGNSSIATIPTAEQVAWLPQLSAEQNRVLDSIGRIVMGDVGINVLTKHQQLKHTAAAAYLHEVVGRNPKPTPDPDPISQLERLLNSIKVNGNVVFKAEYKKNPRMSSLLKIQYSVTIRRIEL